MEGLHSRRTRLVVALLLVGLLCVYVLWHVIWTVFFALTFVYVLYPIRRNLVHRGMNARLVAAILTTGALIGVLALFAPLIFVLYTRRQAFAAFLRNLPLSLEVSLGEFTYVIEASVVVPQVQNALQTLAFDIASAAPTLSAKLFLFVFLIYAILYSPGGVRAIVFRIVEGPVQDELLAYHVRIRDTLYGLYFVQAATGGLTFLIGLPVFYFFGYEAFFSLAVIGGILQFVPILGPSLVVLALSAIEVAAGDVQQAILVAVIGTVFIGVLPDAILRPRLAKYSAGMPASVYFVGFLGGVLTLGPVGIIAGPLFLALFIETMELLSDDIQYPGADATDAEVGRAGSESSLTDFISTDDHPGDPGDLHDATDVTDATEAIEEAESDETDASTDSRDD